MRTSHLPSRARAALLAFLPVALLSVAPTATAQVFAAGVGGGIVNDEGSAENLKNFATGAGFGFIEVSLEPGIVMQGRYTHFQLPPTGENGPDINVDAGTLTIAYLFKEDWWQGGFFAGGGGYRLNPKEPGDGQVVTDPSETVFGLCGGLITVFTVNPRFDIRLEAIGHLIRDVSRRKPIIASVAVGYKF